MFAASDAGGERAAAMYSLLGSAKLNGHNLEAFVREVLTRIADLPITRIKQYGRDGQQEISYTRSCVATYKINDVEHDKYHRSTVRHQDIAKYCKGRKKGAAYLHSDLISCELRSFDGIHVGASTTIGFRAGER